MTREEAIKILTNHRRFVFENSEEDIAIDMAIRALKNEQTDGDLISKNAVLDLVADYNLSMGQVVKGIHALPTVTPQPSAEKTAEWIFYIADNDGNDGKEEKWCKCSKCGYKEFYLPPKRSICPSCKARMKGVEQ